MTTRFHKRHGTVPRSACEDDVTPRSAGHCPWHHPAMGTMALTVKGSSLLPI